MWMELVMPAGDSLQWARIRSAGWGVDVAAGAGAVGTAADG